MQFLTRLARTIEQLERVAQKYDDEDLKALVAELYKQLTTVINVLEKMYAIYTELDVLIKTDLKIEPGLYLETETPQQPEKLVEYIEKLRNAGHDPNKIVAYLLGTGAVRIETRNGELYLIPHSRRVNANETKSVLSAINPAHPSPSLVSSPAEMGHGY